MPEVWFNGQVHVLHAWDLNSISNTTKEKSEREGAGIDGEAVVRYHSNCAWGTIFDAGIELCSAICRISVLTHVLLSYPSNGNFRSKNCIKMKNWDRDVTQWKSTCFIGIRL